MSDGIRIVVCKHFEKEVRAFLAGGEYPDVELGLFSAECGIKGRMPQGSLSVPGRDADGRVIVLGGGCLPQREPAENDRDRTAFLRLPQCFELVLNPAVVAHLIKDGAYLLTPGWLENWKARLDACGFGGNRSLAREFFRESCSRFLLLDTGVSENSAALLSEFASFCDRPAETLAVGLDVLGLHIGILVSDARNRIHRSIFSDKLVRINRQNADYAAALDIAARLAEPLDETRVIEHIIELFTMLFAPKKLCFIKLKNGEVLEIHGAARVGIDGKKLARMVADMKGRWAWSETGKGFCIKIGREKDEKGAVLAEELAFPEYKGHYLNLALNMAEICGLAIDRAQRVKEVLDAEAAGRRLERKLHEMKRLESMAAVAGGVAHDLNNLLQGMTGYLNLATINLPPGAEIASDLQKVEELVETAARLSKQMLACSGRGHFFLTPLDLSAAVREEVARLKDDIILHCELAEDLPDIGASRDQIHMLVQNLVTNAAESYAGNGPGKVFITTSLLFCSSAMLAGMHMGEVRPEGDYVMLEVRDEGCGMGPELQEKIFDPFFSTKFTGRGLGLAAVLGIVRGHKGAVGIQSGVGKGTTVQIFFPPAGR